MITKSIYFDYAATTPVDPSVFGAMRPYLEGDFGNPNSLHLFGQKALAAVDQARIKVAGSIGASRGEIVFTSSATEANNLVIRGMVKNYFRKNKDCKNIPKIIISSIEHPSVMETVKDIELDGSIKAVYLPVNGAGVINLEALKKEIDEDTILISVMWVNNEIGTVQPIAEIADIIRNFRSTKSQISDRKKTLNLRSENSKSWNFETGYPLLHCDAVQAFNYFDLNVLKSGVDFMTLSSHKIYGPKGGGALYIKQDCFSHLVPILTGGGQEYGLRSGTENVAAIVGFGEAAQMAYNLHRKENERLSQLSYYLFSKIEDKFGEIEINGPPFKKEAYSSNDLRSPHILNLYIPKKERLDLALDMNKIAVSLGSACSQRITKPSYVLKSLGCNDNRISHSLRLSLGRMTDLKEIDKLILILEEILSKK